MLLIGFTVELQTMFEEKTTAKEMQTGKQMEKTLGCRKNREIDVISGKSEGFWGSEGSRHHDYQTMRK